MEFLHNIVGSWSNINLFLLFTCPMMSLLGGLVKIAYLYVNLGKIPDKFKPIDLTQNITSPELLKSTVDYVLNSFRYCIYLFKHPRFIFAHLFVSIIAGFVCSLFYLGLFQDSATENFQFVRAWVISLIAGSSVDHILLTREKLIQSLLTSPQIKSHFRELFSDELSGSNSDGQRSSSKEEKNKEENASSTI